MSGAVDADKGTDLMVALKDLFESVSGFKNEKCLNSSQTHVWRNEDRVRGDALRNSSPGSLTAG